jgi:hypothetical protein
LKRLGSPNPNELEPHHGMAATSGVAAPNQRLSLRCRAPHRSAIQRELALYTSQLSMEPAMPCRPWEGVPLAPLSRRAHTARKNPSSLAGASQLAPCGSERRVEGTARHRPGPSSSAAGRLTTAGRAARRANVLTTVKAARGGAELRALPRARILHVASKTASPCT